MLVKNINIVKSIFFYYYLPLQYNKKQVLPFKYYKKAVSFGNQRGFIMGKRVLTKLQVSKIATFWNTLLTIWALNTGLVNV